MGPRGLSLLGGALLAGLAAGLALAERRRPLRASTQPRLRRELRNAAMATISGVAVTLLERPVILPLARWTEARRTGLVHRLGLAPVARAALAVLLMDYTLYLWHALLHRWPPLWRLHLPHHADLDLDASTGLRFHPAQLAASIPWRALQVLLIGVGPRALSIWRMLTVGCILFHHSNLRIPPRLEQRLGWVLATPRMHGIHHSTVRSETNSNWSSGLSVWDRLHGTLRLEAPQGLIEIGVPAYRDARELRLRNILRMPFERQRPTWVDRHGCVRRRGPEFQLLKEPA